MKTDHQYLFFLFIILISRINSIPPKKISNNLCSIDQPVNMKDKDSIIFNVFDLENKIPFKVNKEVYDELKSLSNKFQTFKVIDIERKKPKRIKKIKKPLKIARPPVNIKPIKNITQIFINNHDETKEFLRNVENDKLNASTRIKELIYLKKKLTTKKNHTLIKEKIKINLKIHLAAIKDFFEWMIKGFKKIKGKNEEILYNNTTFILDERILTSFQCEAQSGLSVDYRIMNELKQVVQKIDHRKYKESMGKVILVIRKFINLINSTCQGLGYFMDVIEKYLMHMNEKTINPNYFANISYLKEKLLSEIDKNSFSEAGFTLGKIYGEARKYSYYFC